MSISKAGLQADLTEAIRGRDQVTAATLRMALTAITTEEAAGEQHALTEEQVQQVLAKEAKKRREAAAAYEHAGRPELAATELAELAVLEGYLPAQLDDAAIAALVDEAIAATGATGMAQMGQVMKAVTAKVAGRAEGGRVAALVRAKLSG
ncbi:MAG: GatB/YqeY domain-containing protein [Tetrasphaera sp.]